MHISWILSCSRWCFTGCFFKDFVTSFIHTTIFMHIFSDYALNYAIRVISFMYRVDAFSNICDFFLLKHTYSCTYTFQLPVHLFLPAGMAGQSTSTTRSKHPATWNLLQSGHTRVTNRHGRCPSHCWSCDKLRYCCQESSSDETPTERPLPVGVEGVRSAWIRIHHHCVCWKDVAVVYQVTSEWGGRKVEGAKRFGDYTGVSAEIWSSVTVLYWNEDSGLSCDQWACTEELFQRHIKST